MIQFIVLVLIIYFLVKFYMASKKSGKKAPDAPPPENPFKKKPVAEDPKKTAPMTDDFSGMDKDAFARAMAAMSGDAPAPEKPAAPKSEPPKAPSAPGDYDAFLEKVLNYYHSMWNKETGSLYTELDTTMPIDHFAVQVREHCLVESVWLQGDSIPLVTETEFTQICGSTPICLMNTSESQTNLLLAIAKYLVGLGTVTLKGNDFYPVRAKKQAPPAAEKPAGDDPDAALLAQMQAMLDQMSSDGGEQK